MATTRTYTTNQAPFLTHPGISEGDLPLVKVIGNAINTANDNQTATDIAQLLQVRLGQYVMFVGLQVVILATSTSGVDIGDGTNDDAYIDAFDLTQAVGTIQLSALSYTIGSGTVISLGGQNNALFAGLGGKLYAADDTIDAVFDNTTAVGAFKIRALVASFFDVDF